MYIFFTFSSVYVIQLERFDIDIFCYVFVSLEEDVIVEAGERLIMISYFESNISKHKLSVVIIPASLCSFRSSFIPNSIVISPMCHECILLVIKVATGF
jgi:hypothetical protein